MKFYIEVATNRFGLTAHQVRQELARKGIILGPELSDDTANAYGYQIVTGTERPKGDVVTEITPELVDGVYEQRWEVREYNESELKERLENRRMSKLQHLDYALENSRTIGAPTTFGEGEEAVVEHIQLRSQDMRNLSNIYRKLQTGDKSIRYIRTYENNNHELSAEEMIIVVEDAMDYDMELMQKWRDMKDELNAATSEADLIEVGDVLVIE